MQIDSDSVLLSFESIKHRKELMISRFGVTPQIAESIFAQVLISILHPPHCSRKRRLKINWKLNLRIQNYQLQILPHKKWYLYLYILNN